MEYPQNVEELEALAQRPIAEMFETARFEVRRGWMLSEETAAEQDAQREQLSTFVVGEVDFLNRQFEALETFRPHESEDISGYTTNVYGKGHHVFLREPETSELFRHTAGEWFTASTYDFPIYFDRSVSEPRGTWGLLDLQGVDQKFEDLGGEEIQGMSTRHVRFSARLESNTEMWGGGEEILVDASFELWLDELQRPVRTRMEIPFTAEAFLFEVDFWDFDQAVAIELPDGLDVRPSGEPYGVTSGEVSHSLFGNATVTPNNRPFLSATDWFEDYTRIEMEFALEPGEAETRRLHIEVFLRDENPLGVYPPAATSTVDHTGSVVPGTYFVRVDTWPIIVEDLPEPPEGTVIACPDDAPITGELRVVEVEFESHDTDGYEHLDLERIHVEFEHGCVADGETITTTGTFRFNATN